MDETGLLTKFGLITETCPECGLSILHGVRAMIDCNVSDYGVCESHLSHLVALHPELARGVVPGAEEDAFTDERTSPCPFARGVAIWYDIEQAIKAASPSPREEAQTLRVLIAMTKKRLALTLPRA